MGSGKHLVGSVWPPALGAIGAGALAVGLTGSGRVVAGSLVGLVALSGLLAWLRRWFVLPILALDEAVRLLEGGGQRPPERPGAAPELAELAERLGELLRTLEAKRAERREALEEIGHNLDAPLDRLQESLDQLALRRSRLEEPDQRALGHALVQAGALRRMVGELLEVTCLEEGRLPIELSRFDLREPVRETVELFQSHFPGRSFELRLPAGPAHVRGDVAHIGQALNNLLAQALRRARPNAQARIVLEAADGEGREATVRLSAEGGSPVGFADLFQDRHLLDDALRDVPGAIFGLAASKRLLEAQGGRLLDGPGRSLELRLPLEPQPEGQPRGAAAGAEALLAAR
jgi:signal transduction histidine kinase